MIRIDEKPRQCLYCGAEMKRKRFNSGRLECLTRFINRLYCDRLCFKESMKGRSNNEN